MQGIAILTARDTAFSTTPGKVGLETPTLAGGHAALVIGIQVIPHRHHFLSARGRLSSRPVVPRIPARFRISGMNRWYALTPCQNLPSCKQASLGSQVSTITHTRQESMLTILVLERVELPGIGLVRDASVGTLAPSGEEWSAGGGLRVLGPLQQQVLLCKCSHQPRGKASPPSSPILLASSIGSDICQSTKLLPGTTKNAVIQPRSRPRCHTIM